jgi:hypothetical protein
MAINTENEINIIALSGKVDVLKGAIDALVNRQRKIIAALKLHGIDIDMQINIDKLK